MTQDIIVEFITQTPGEYESPGQNYKGRAFRTVFFLDDFVLAQFYEVDNNIIRDWRAGDHHTTAQDQTYTSINLSLESRRFLAVYHDDPHVTFDQARAQLESSLA